MDYAKLYSGEHLKEINPSWTFEKWSYRHTFVEKMKFVTNLIGKLSKETKILDAGCGQGLLVEEFKRRGYDITGVDAFYGSENVRKENILKTGFEDDSFDVILCLDVIEHFPLNEQEYLVKELTRICKKGGKVIWSIPNLANLSSRILFLFSGNLLRTANARETIKPTSKRLELYHPGDRPIKEYYGILSRHLSVVQKKGLAPMIPVLSQIIQMYPSYTGWLYTILKPFGVFSGWCFNVVVVGEKK